MQIPDDYAGRVINIHPSLIPAFCGRGFHGRAVHQAALDTGVKVSGCTVHFADATYDTGPIILQRVVPVEDDDTPETLASRVFQAECQALPEAIALYAQGRLRVEGRRVRVLETAEGSSECPMRTARVPGTADRMSFARIATCDDLQGDASTELEYR